MTPEEKAVIEAAEEAELLSIGGLIPSFFVPLAKAVRALRESRKPKPRYVAMNDCVLDTQTGELLGSIGLAAALNAQEQK